LLMPTHIVGVAGIVKDDTGKILLVKTVNYGWVFPGGQVEVGENLMTALNREIKEESGIAINADYLVGVYSNTCSHVWQDAITLVPTKVVLDFACTSIGGELGTSDETSESAWILRDKVLEMISTPAIRTRYQAYLDFDGRIKYMEYVTSPQFELKLQRTI
jgi:8-oxo-dGTP diphosphatase